MRDGQEEAYRNRDVSLHLVQQEGEWIGVRIYLLRGNRRRAWQFGVNANTRRVSKVSDVSHLEGAHPSLLSWAVGFAFGQRREAPPLDTGDGNRLPTRDELLRAVDLIEEAYAKHGKWWSFAPNTRGKGRYVVDNLCLLMDGLPLKVSEAIVQTLALNDVIKSEVVDSRMKRYGLVVHRERLDEMLEKLTQRGVIDV